MEVLSAIGKVLYVIAYIVFWGLVIYAHVLGILFCIHDKRLRDARRRREAKKYERYERNQGRRK